MVSNSRQFQELKRSLERYADEVVDQARSAVENEADATRNAIRNKIVFDDLYATRQLYLATNTQHFRVGNSYHSEVRVDTDYAAYLEFGTGSNFVPPTRNIRVRPFAAPTFSRRLVTAIQLWSQNKLTLPAFDIQDAIAVARDLSENGQRPQPFVRPVWFRHKPVMRSRVVSNVKSAKRVF